MSLSSRPSWTQLLRMGVKVAPVLAMPPRTDREAFEEDLKRRAAELEAELRAEQGLPPIPQQPHSTIGSRRRRADTATEEAEAEEGHEAKSRRTGQNTGLVSPTDAATLAMPPTTAAPFPPTVGSPRSYAREDDRLDEQDVDELLQGEEDAAASAPVPPQPLVPVIGEADDEVAPPSDEEENEQEEGQAVDEDIRNRGRGDPTTERPQRSETGIRRRR